ncbi:lipase family protein [Mycobacterium sp. M26]|uniref:lipase family protein n=1 Tax=Mycobacterium sp. M26 TaxID=1762962 RepID=UPI00073EA914|nr:lipase family protein [Mycobacterium sp. M26]
MRWTRPVVILGALVASLVLTAAGVVAYRTGALWMRGAGAGAPVPVSSATLGGSGPGSLVSAMTMPTLTGALTSLGVHSARVVYRSTDGDSGDPTVVSGTVFVPKGTAPQGGWPVLAFGHGTTGIQEPCAPSLSDNLLGQAPVVAGWIKLGFAVAFADYQGLGSPGHHPYLDARTAGRNIIDAVRALRATFPDVSSHFGAFGGSQGGGAVWAADEQVAEYAPELTLVGAVALSPAADMVGLVEKAQRGTLTTDQRPLLQWVLASLGRLHPQLNLDDFRHGVAAANWDALSACAGALVHTRAEVAPDIGPFDFAPSSPRAAAVLTGLLREWALPQRPLAAPLSVVYGTADTYIDPEWTTRAIAQACDRGGMVVWRLEDGKGHADIDAADQISWLVDRFHDKPAANGCVN